MSTADLSKKATLESMEQLGDIINNRIQNEKMEALEKAGKEPTTHSTAFEGRNGYDSHFLDGWKMPIPMPGGDMRELRRGGSGVELKYQNFSVIMSASRRMPLITAVNINGSDSRKVPRISVWSFDGRLDKEDQWGDEIYDGNILDRGHMVRREDPIWGADFKNANSDTFHFTNSCPQIAGVNQKTWLGLENYVLQNARTDEMMVNVFTGPFLKDDDLEYRGARVPSSFWKVVAIVKEDGTPSATAYRVSQEKELGDLEYVYSVYKTFQISIAEVIDETGIDFSLLTPYDGFSQNEKATGKRTKTKLESLSDIRI